MGKLTTNKYGKQIYLPDHKDTIMEKAAEKILLDMSVDYVKQYFFDEDGCRRIKFDFAVLDKNGKVRLLIECDGDDHYFESFYLSTGVRYERTKPHVVKRQIADARKAKVANDHNICLLKIDNCYLDIMDDVIKAYIWTFIDNETDETLEVSMVKMLDKYKWNFPYIIPSKLSKAEEAFLRQRFPEQFKEAN